MPGAISIPKAKVLLLAIVSDLCNVLVEFAEKTSPSIKICIKNDSKPAWQSDKGKLV